MIDIIVAIVFGIVEGITEWLPISSTGHMILLNEFLKLDVKKDFFDMFLIVIQLGAIFAVIFIFWSKIWPFGIAGVKDKEARKYLDIEVKGLRIKTDFILMWLKIVAACLPAVIFVVLGLDEKCDELFYKPLPVAIALIIFGIFFILIENYNKNRKSSTNHLLDISLKTALFIGLFQLLAAAFPGTSRSGATILGALLIGVSRKAASEFTFILAIPVMLGASLLKVLDFGFSFTGTEIAILLSGMISAFLVSVVVIKFLLEYIRKHDFKVFGWYRIALGILVVTYFAFLD